MCGRPRNGKARGFPDFSRWRGAHKPGTDLVTSRMLGVFRDNALMRQELLGLANSDD